MMYIDFGPYWAIFATFSFYKSMNLGPCSANAWTFWVENLKKKIDFISDNFGLSWAILDYVGSFDGGKSSKWISFWTIFAKQSDELG